MDNQASAWLSGADMSSSPHPNSTPSTMEEGFRTRFGNSDTFSSPPPPLTKKDSTTTYDPTTLKTIGQKCSTRLPPANAVQAMFLYEMQRQTESEQLFNNQMFRLARSEDASTLQQRKIDELEGKMSVLEKAVRTRDVEDRLATSKSTMHMLGEKLAGVVKKVEGMEVGIKQLSEKLQEVQVAGEKAEERRDSVMAAPKSEEGLVKTMKEEIDILFDDRDGILKMIKELQDRLASLNKGGEQTSPATIVAPIEPEPTAPQTNGEPLIDLTNGTTPTAAPASPQASSTPRGPHAKPQRLPLRTTSTTQPPLDLAVPKGKAAVGLRGSAHAPPPVPAPSNLRTFSPGKPWAS